eukprot:CAMPEP_0206050788 /NCGR_PEP_ID=MMETSP1466-20131121/29992_1 /ASSEMBLY_ACC=CAM_ASM_001126 /TAXON_ID=44452 /ORGANISM="Pavlova gyrans, Strain CCMP608" /LENGTH=89 /DNA_ID=CAMNT_0053425905 /DNA_START=52 /DNA_END=318 /DNA_ORIENTATION=-
MKVASPFSFPVRLSNEGYPEQGLSDMGMSLPHLPHDPPSGGSGLTNRPIPWECWSLALSPATTIPHAATGPQRLRGTAAPARRALAASG